ncbi:HIT family protein [Candidatus Woesearchaeota archaeon]|nr:HIT family protein [Candidatus Woesearchaeota archaeon]
MHNCIFCKILTGEIPTLKVYEDTHAIAFLDVNPVSKGHTLVIPKTHYETLSLMPETEFLSYMATVHKVVKGLMKYTDGVNVLQNNGKDAGQLVPHVHFHIIPRRPGDGLKIGEWHVHHDPDLDKVQMVIKSLLKE